MTPSIPPGPREASPDDVAAIAALLEAKRAQYQSYSPVFWRPAPDARARHEPFLESLVRQDGPVALVCEGDSDGDADAELDGAVLALPRPADWLVDDFAVRRPDLWASTGAALLEAVRARTPDRPLTVVCGEQDQPKRAMLRERGARLREQWWIHPLDGVPDPEGDRPAGRDAPPTSGADGRIIDAPPVYDPGGPVCLAQAWDGSGTALGGLEGWAQGQGAVLVIVPAPADDADRHRALRQAGYHVASEWYGLGPQAT